VIEFHILGPLEVRDHERTVQLAGRQRAILAILLLRRGEPVSTEQLVGAVWGERPPPTAAKSVQVRISELRRALGDGHIVRQGGGYVLRLAPGALDLERFETLVSEGRRLLDAGEAGGSAARLGEALALWRGPPLADLRHEDFAQLEIARLVELHIAALEDRIEADLERGRSGELVAELEALVRTHPLRERLRRQLILALYRCGRQADALAAYRDARQVLVETLGIEPGPSLQALQRRVLDQDPSLEAPRPAPTEPNTRGRDSGSELRRASAARRAPAALLAAGGLVVLAAAIAAVVVAVSGGGKTAGLAAVAPDSLGVIDPRSNAIVAQVPVGANPVAVTVDERAVWVANAGDSTVTRVDPAARRAVRVIGTSRRPSAIAAGGGAVWVASATVGQGRGTITRIDAVTGSVAEPVTVRRNDEADPFAPATPSTIAVGQDGVWVNHVRRQLLHMDAAPGARLRPIGLGGSEFADGIAFYRGSLWVTSSATDRLLRINPATGAVIARIPIAATGRRVAGPYDVAAGDDAVWVADSLGDAVTRVDPTLNAVTATTRVGRRPTRLAIGAGGVWVLNAGDGTVARIDPRSNTPVATIAIAARATDIAAGAGAVWVTVAGGTAKPAARAVPATAEPLPASSCSRMSTAPGASPRYLIASSLPHHEPGGVAPDDKPGVAARMTRAIQRVLETHKYRVGRYSLGYQACDDSTPNASGWDPERCPANAEAYVRNPSLLGIIGPYHSVCSALQLPILNAAPGGPVAMVSPANTMVGLTRAGPGTVADEPDRYYPTGARNYVRVVGADDRQGAALALLADRLGARRTFVLHDGQTYGIALTTYFRQAASRLHLPIAGVASWNAEHRTYAALARRIARSRPDAVLVAGCICENGVRLIRDLRAALGPEPRLLVTDAFGSFENELRSIRHAADGLYLTIMGPSAQSLSTHGRALLDPLRHRTRGGLDPFAITAAQAAEVLLDAIARSDGTRASVADAVLDTRLRDGIAGAVRFDANGDVIEAPALVYRRRFGAPPIAVPGSVTPDFVLDRVLTPPRQLVP
jgi:DNA-binding SARP family transcriptional activator/DNA-binding beta-propeller fold protein YncE